MNKKIDLHPYNIVRPEKVSWSVVSKTANALDLIKSKSLRNFLQKAPQLLLDHGIVSSFEELSKDAFIEWLAFYTAKMNEHDYDVLANEAWYDKRSGEGKKIYGLFYHQHGKLVGSGIVTISDTKGTLSFKASERIDLASQTNSSFGSIIDFMFMQKTIELGKKEISGGVSRNDFGVTNTLGYLDYKLRIGYEPEPAKTAAFLSEVTLNDDGIVLFYGVKDDTFALYALTPESWDKSFEVARFATENIPFVHLRYN